MFVGDSGADDGEDFGVGGIDNDGRALQEVGFEAVAFFQGRQRAGERFLGFLLDERVEGGEDVEAVFGEVFGFVVFAQLLVNEVNEGGEAHAVALGFAVHDVQRQ